MAKNENPPKESKKSIPEIMKEIGLELETDEELQNSGGICIIGAKMPKPKDDSTASKPEK
jgi:hypothetical protein